MITSWEIIDNKAIKQMSKGKEILKDILAKSQLFDMYCILYGNTKLVF